MQTDNWLTDNNYDQCPMCSKLLRRGAGICYACGFTLNPSPVFPTAAAQATSAVWIDPTMHGYQYVMPHQSGGQPGRERVVPSAPQPRRQPDPTTPIPPRASAHPAQPGTTRRFPASRYFANGGEQHHRTTGNLKGPVPAASPVWQYESSDYEAAGSLPALSMFVPEAPTQPQRPVRARATRRLPEIDEIDTVPPGSPGSSVPTSYTAQNGYNPHNAPTAPISLRLDGASHPSLAMIPAQHDDEIDTAPQLSEQRSMRALVPAHSTALQASSGSSWTAGGASVSPYARLLVNPSKRRKRIITLNPLEHLRWWLLRPGRIEFMLWLGGTLLLIGVTCVLLLVSAFSFQWFIPGVPAPLSTSNSGTQSHIASITSSPGLWMERVDKGLVVPGQPVQLRGRGFSHSSRVTFSLDGSLPLSDQDGNPGSARPDAHGTFDTTLLLGSGNGWVPGSHIIIARDVATGRLAVTNIVLAASTNGTIATPVSTSTQGVTHTPTPTTTPGVQGSPVNKTPVPTSPTPTTPVASPSPSPTHAPTNTPTVTPTVKTTPTVTPTMKTTPTVTPTGAAHSPTASPSTGGSNLGNDLNASGGTSFGARLTTVSPLVWVMVACYSLSMALLGVAGVLYKRRQ